MTREEFQILSRKPVILDGATGSNLMRAGMPRGVCTEQWVLEHEDVLIELQRAYVDAGSQIVLAPTFGANRCNLGAHGLADNLADMNRRLVDISMRAVGGRAYIAGDLSTSGRVIGSSGEATYEEALERYREQISVLAETGVDLLIAETMLTIDETAAAVEAAAEVCDLPILCSMTVQADGSLFFGGDARTAAETLQALGASAVGINCSVGPDQLASVIAGIRKIAEVPVIAKPNAGMPTITEKGEAFYSMTPKDFAYHMEQLVRAGAGLIGGCCGTTPEYIREMCGRILPV